MRPVDARGSLHDMAVDVARARGWLWAATMKNGGRDGFVFVSWGARRGELLTGAALEDIIREDTGLFVHVEDAEHFKALSVTSVKRAYVDARACAATGTRVRPMFACRSYNRVMHVEDDSDGTVWPVYEAPEILTSIAGVAGDTIPDWRVTTMYVNEPLEHRKWWRPAGAMRLKWFTGLMIDPSDEVEWVAYRLRVDDAHMDPPKMEELDNVIGLVAAMLYAGPVPSKTLIGLMKLAVPGVRYMSGPPVSGRFMGRLWTREKRRSGYSSRLCWHYMLTPNAVRTIEAWGLRAEVMKSVSIIAAGVEI